MKKEVAKKGIVQPLRKLKTHTPCLLTNHEDEKQIDLPIMNSPGLTDKISKIRLWEENMIQGINYPVPLTRKITGSTEFNFDDTETFDLFYCRSPMGGNMEITLITRLLNLKLSVAF